MLQFSFSPQTSIHKQSIEVCHLPIDWTVSCAGFLIFFLFQTKNSEKILFNIEIIAICFNNNPYYSPITTQYLLIKIVNIS